MAPETRHVRLISSLPPDQLMVQRAHVVEELGRPFVAELELLSPDPQLKFADLLGDQMALELELPDGTRYFHGHVTRFAQGGLVGRYTRYHCTLRPHFWLLTRASDSHIYKSLAVPDLVKQVVGKLGLGPIEAKLQGSYLPREYTVQYRETFFDFLSRLMEEEGIFYWFRHEKTQHTMVLCDDPGSLKAVEGYEKIPFIDPAVNSSPREEHFAEWTLVQEFQTSAFVVNDFDFEVPRADLKAKLSRPLQHKHANLEQYDPLAGYVDAVDAGGDGDPHRADRAEFFARVRLEEQQAPFDRAVAVGNARGPHAGALFELSGHPRDEQNRELMVLRAEYRMFQPGYDAGSAAGQDAEKGKPAKEDPLFTVELLVQPSKLPFRPQRTTPRASIAGPHSAIVVGSGEIWTDKYGRVKLHFPWDREDIEGCWVRVTQTWAGGGWGGLHVPRVGQEVIVEFIEGDPDRPIITGRVYNGANAPPFGMPDGATKSGVLSRSSKGGSADTANEISLEDKKGSELVFIHAEKDMSTEVEKDQTAWIGQDRRKTVDRDQFEHIKRNKKINVDGAHVEDITKTMSLTVGGNEDETIGGSRTVNVGANHTETISGVQGITVGAAAAWSVGGAGTINWGGVGAFTVGGNLTFGVGGNLAQSVNKNTSLDCSENVSTAAGKKLSMDVGEDMVIAVKKKFTTTVDDEHKITVKKGHGLKAKSIVIEGEDDITLKSGDSQIILKKSGDITIKGKNVSVKADSDITLKGSKVADN